LGLIDLSRSKTTKYVRAAFCRAKSPFEADPARKLNLDYAAWP